MHKNRVTSIKSHKQLNVKSFLGGKEGNTSTDNESAGTMSDENDLKYKWIIIVFYIAKNSVLWGVLDTIYESMCII